MSLVKKVIKDCATGLNGEDYDPARVIGYGIIVVGSLIFLGLSIYDTIKTGKFDYAGFATGFGSIGLTLASAGAGVWFKKDTEAT